MKYSAAILLFAAVAFWSSASARPHDREQQDVIDAFTRWAIAEMDQLPEPHKTKLTNKLHQAQHQHWDNLMEYMTYVQSMLIRYVRESGIELSRRKRDVDSNEIVVNDEFNTKILYGVYARILIEMAPPAHREALKKKYSKALEKNYESEDNFEVEAVKIFEEETGLDFEEIEAEWEADEEKAAEFEQKLTEELIKALASAAPEQADSSEEE